MSAKLLNLVALSSLAILACSFGPSPVTALSADSHGHVARHAFRGHDSVAKRKRANTKRCKARTSSSTLVASTTPPAVSTTAVSTTHVVKSSSTTVKATTTKVSTTSKAAATTASSSSSGSSSGSKVALAWPNGDDSSLKYWKTDKVSVYVDFAFSFSVSRSTFFFSCQSLHLEPLRPQQCQVSGLQPCSHVVG